jgi:hypothetical protein
MSTAVPSPLDLARAECAHKLLALRLTCIVGAADASDARALIDDIEAICAAVDPLIAAIGDYAAENFHGIDLKLFRDQLRGALEGNATYELECAAERLAEEAAEIAADPRGYAKARRLEVDWAAS